MIDEETGYAAVRGRDARFDGVFFFAVATTGIYCRPSCPAVTPKQRNVRYYPTAAAAQSGGFRACRRCRPDAVPGSPEWNIRADVVGRAMRLIGDGVVDREGVAGLADRLGYSSRQVHRQLTAEVGAGPVALARAQRALAARVLLQTTTLSVTDTAFAAGFASVRQFNDTIREVYARTPSELRAAARATKTGSATKTGNATKEGSATKAGSAAARAAEPGGLAPGSAPGSGVPLRLAYRGPYDAAGVFDFLRADLVPGIEEITGQPGRRTYRRTLRLPHGPGVAEVDERGRSGWLDCRLRLADLRDLTTAVQRVRRLFDLDADPYAIADSLRGDPLLGPLVAARPGLRSPGAADPDELAVRAVLGGPAAAGALVTAYGEPLPVADGGLTHLFPEPARIGDPALRPLTAALADGTLRLDPGADRDEAGRVLLTLSGIDPWTAGYIRLRALGDPDVALPNEPPLSDAWRPWRSYALHHLWAAGHRARPRLELTT
ncbi:AlkA N-terminal domain-containing protein [Streptomyces sp. H10-C2]|uniref:bifunctional transcriptional activator/DNA repair enzyme AdaA n=1 Tax=unclassified Streptomyces TaxID=2593676 RepID=UPI0024B89D81|nr:MULTISPECIES: AlkA N-terminal domain-containing protein [unclassified Streptomyces]MDJ0340730.1 AlkA N-terminal domain-containing protein [Streptomyces sp. PH10-H1]MDJ0371998.1 AlkA N-terminal domain-containing protein [Streptomyces sp. H10-C2]